MWPKSAFTPISPSSTTATPHPEINGSTSTATSAPHDIRRIILLPDSALFPFNSCRGLGRNIVDHPVDAFDFVDDPVRHLLPHLGGQLGPIRSHRILAGDGAHSDHVLIGALIAHHPDGLHRDEHGERLPQIAVEVGAAGPPHGPPLPPPPPAPP